MEFVKSIRDQAKQEAVKELEPRINQVNQLTNKLSWQDQVRQFTSQNPEASKNMAEITQVLQENPALMGTKNPLDAAYRMAMSNKLLANGNVVDSILGNEEYKTQLMQNPQLKEAIIQEYQAQLNSGNGQVVPPIMGTQGGTSIPASSGSSPNNLREAKQSALRRWQQLSQG